MDLPDVLASLDMALQGARERPRQAAERVSGHVVGHGGTIAKRPLDDAQQILIWAQKL